MMIYQSELSDTFIDGLCAFEAAHVRRNVAGTALIKHTDTLYV